MPAQAYIYLRTFGALPRAGGAFDQDADLMEEMSVIAAIVNEAERAEAGL